jgi:hypothetical protein
MKTDRSNLKSLKNNEIKNSQKTSVHFKIFGGNRIQKFEETCPTKFIEVKNVGKTGKIRKSPFLKNRENKKIVLFLKTAQFLRKLLCFLLIL